LQKVRGNRGGESDHAKKTKKDKAKLKHDVPHNIGFRNSEPPRTESPHRLTKGEEVGGQGEGGRGDVEKRNARRQLAVSLRGDGQMRAFALLARKKEERVTTARGGRCLHMTLLPNTERASKNLRRDRFPKGINMDWGKERGFTTRGTEEADKSDNQPKNQPVQNRKRKAPKR